MKLKLKLFIDGVRLYSLPATIAPVLLGLVIAHHKINSINIFSATITLLSAVLMQIGANLSNDYYDYINKVDTDGRLGPNRITGSNKLNPKIVKLSFMISFMIALILGIYLIVIGGIPIAVIGITSLILAFLYTGGPYPLAYYAMGEITVILYYGPVAVWGTYFIQTKQFDLLPAVLGLIPGFISSTIMAINNLRDRITDKKAGKHTLANIFGYNFAKILPISFIFIASLIPLIYYNEMKYKTLIFIFLPLLFFRTWKNILSNSELNLALKRTGQFLLLYSLVLGGILSSN